MSTIIGDDIYDIFKKSVENTFWLVLGLVVGSVGTWAVMMYIFEWNK